MLKKNGKNGMYAVSEAEYISDCGDWEVSTKTGKPEVYHLGEPIDMGKVDVPDFVQKIYDSLK